VNFSKHVKTIRVSNAVGAGQTTITGTTVDMQGFDSVQFEVLFGAITAGGVQSIKARQGADSGMSDAADLLGTGQTVADDDDNKVFYIDLHEPLERYVDVQVLRATQDSAIDGILAHLYNAKDLPITEDANVSGEFFQSPIEGTA
jgi:hypothetical protein